VEHAIALDPNLADAHAALGKIRGSYYWDWLGADAAYKRALELDPGNSTVVRWASSLAITLGRFEEGLRLARRAVELDPLSVSAHHTLGLHASYAGRLDEAEMALRKALELDPAYPGARQSLARVFLARSQPQAALEQMQQETEPFWRRDGLALAYHALGRQEQADAALADLLEKDKSSAAFQIAEVYAFRSERDKAFDWLERAYAQRDGGLAEIKGDPLLKNLESDPRYAAFLKKMRLPL